MAQSKYTSNSRQGLLAHGPPWGPWGLPGHWLTGVIIQNHLCFHPLLGPEIEAIVEIVWGSRQTSCGDRLENPTTHKGEIVRTGIMYTPERYVSGFIQVVSRVVVSGVLSV